MEHIVYEPHYHTITNTGRSHFSRVSDAMAEFVDNGIQACSGNDFEKKRQITVSLYLSSSTANFITVMDNGIGMNTDGLQTFATYSYDQETRNNRPKQNDKSFISKFGVGVKQAGFFLGDRIKVLTKVKDDENVREFTLSKDDFQEKSRNNSNVYEGEVRLRTKGDMQYMCGDEIKTIKMVNAIRAHEELNEQFTVFVIRVNDDVARRLGVKDHNRYERIPGELADIYHYHLHPEHKPEKLKLVQPVSVIPTPKSSKGKKGRKDREVGADDDANTSSSTISTVPAPLEADLPKLSLLYTVCVDATVAVRLSDLADLQSGLAKCVDLGQSPFFFTMELPDPIPDNSAVAGAVLQLTQTAYSKPSSVEKRRVEGVLYYYPYVEGRETNPLAYGNSRNTAIDLDGSSSSSNSSSGNGINSIPGGNEAGTLNIFWQDRLVPESVLSRLPFFPTCNTPGKCDSLKLPNNWRERLHGYLFFDWTFRHISNNKLKLQVDPNLETWINDKKTFDETLFTPKNAQKEFLSWLQRSHKDLDQEFTFQVRLFCPVPDPKTHCVYFSELNYGNGRLVVRSGQRIKFKAAKTGAVCVLAEIVDFEVKETLSPDEVKCSGTGNLRYRRLPAEIFGDTMECESVTSLDFSSLAAYSVSEKEISALLNKQPAHVSLVLFEHNSDATVPLEEAFLIPGVTYYKIGAQVMDHHGELVVGRPESASSAAKYGVQMSLQGVDMGRTAELWEFKDGKDRAVGVGKKLLSSCYYSFFDVKFNKVGPVSLVMRVLDREKVVLETEFVVNVAAKHAERFDFVASPFTNETYRFGEAFPGFDLKFLDDQDNEVDYIGELQLTLSSELMQVSLRDKKRKAVTYSLFNDDRGVLQVRDDPWVVMPVRHLLSKSRVEESTLVVFRLEIHTPVMDINGVETFSGTLGTPIEFTVQFRAGLPRRLRLLDKVPSDFTVKNGELLEPSVLRFAVFDAWGNRVAPPKGRKWYLELGDGPCSEQNALAALSQSQSSRSNTKLVTSSGEAILSNLRVDLEGVVSHQGEEAQQYVALNSAHDEDDFTEFEPLILLLHVLPTCCPTTLQIMKDGVPLDENASLTVSAGEPLTGLSFRILDDVGEVVAVDEQWVQHKTSSILVSWLATQIKHKGKERRCVIPADFALPDVRIGTTADAHSSTDCDVTLTLMGKSLSAYFSVAVKAGEPHSWALVSAGLEEGLMISEGHEELRAKIRGVCLVDRYGNRIESSAHDTPPILTARSLSSDSSDALLEGDTAACGEHGADDEAGESSDKKRKLAVPISPKKRARSGQDAKDVKPVRRLPLQFGSATLQNDEAGNTTKSPSRAANNKRSVRDDDVAADGASLPMCCFVLSEEASLSGFSLDAEVELQVADAENRFEPQKIATTAIAGYPRRIVVSSEYLQIPDLAAAHQVDVAAFTNKLSDLRIVCLDNDGNKCSMRGLALDLVISAPGGRKLFSAKGIKTSVIEPKNISLNFSEYSDSRELDELLGGSDDDEQPGATQQSSIRITCSITYKLRGQLVAMTPAHLYCSLKKLNVVVGVALTLAEATCSQSAATSLLLDGTSFALTLPAGDRLPAIDVTLQTDDQAPLLPCIEDLVVSIKPWGVATSNVSAASKKKKNSRNSILASAVSSLTFEAAYTMRVSVDKCCVELVPVGQSGNVLGQTDDLFRDDCGGLSSEDESISPSATSLVGEYELSITYFEKRPAYSMLPSDQKKKTSVLKISIVPGAPVKLSPDVHSLSNLDNRTVCDCLRDEERLIGKNIVFHLYDKFGNLCRFPAGLTVVCTTRPMLFGVTDCSSSGAIPSLEGAEDGFIVADISSHQRSCIFPKISIQRALSHGSEDNHQIALVDDSDYELVFSLARAAELHGQDAMDEDQTALQEAACSSLSWSAAFHFTSDEYKQATISKQKDELRPLKAELARVQQLKAQIKVVNQKIIDVMQHTSQLSSIANLRDCLESQQEVASLIQRRQQQVSDMESRSAQARPAKKPQNFPPAVQVAGLDTLGMVVDLMYVDDENEALIMSWAAIALIDAIVVRTTEVATAIYKRPNNALKVWSLDQMQRFQVKDGNGFRRRNQEEVARRVIPYAPVQFAGNPRHLVNLVQLDPENEHYRDTIFHVIFGPSLLFDDIDSATEYRAGLIAKNQRPPIIYTVAGDRIAATGVLDPRGGRKPDELKLVFGEQNPCNTAEYSKIKAELDVLEALAGLTQQRDELLLQMRSVNVDEISRRCQQIEAALRDFGANFTQVA